MYLEKENIAGYLREFTFEENRNLSLFPPDSATVVELVNIGGAKTPRFTNEFWTPRQRQSSSIHEISYRACFKAQLPRFFVRLLTKPGDTVYDPFSGRGTTVIEAAILNRKVVSNDVNPLSKIMAGPRLSVPDIEEVYSRIDSIPVDRSTKADIDLSMFYHQATEAGIVSINVTLNIEKRAGQKMMQIAGSRWWRPTA